ncbi:ATP synthase F1 subunit delta [Sediminibacterium roseum]|uniref:ATP synthase subunit delta n=1 Tax=Sediminibacterium roseum TaxID=1978412 RepID=A0ABW9ZUG9_9BACT|nr:ATP synthase F1 subunit delta [Sediminibacterium roseum]NCI48863.1 ATP synthase F1 subunit delta [Sediminibacterium roseum]
MPNPRLADRYAKSLIDLSTEKGQLEAVYADMKYLQAVCKSSKEFVAVLKSPVINTDQKNNIVAAVTKGKVSALTDSFNTLLVKKKRESDLPEIASAFIDQYNAIKGIHRVKLTTAVPVSDELKKSIEAKVKSAQNLGSVELETVVDEKLIGGFVLEFNNKLVDASILRDLNDVKKQFAGNLFVQQLR